MDTWISMDNLKCKELVLKSVDELKDRATYRKILEHMARKLNSSPSELSGPVKNVIDEALGTGALKCNGDDRYFLPKPKKTGIQKTEEKNEEPKSSKKVDAKDVKKIQSKMKKSEAKKVESKQETKEIQKVESKVDNEMKKTESKAENDVKKSESKIENKDIKIVE